MRGSDHQRGVQLRFYLATCPANFGAGGDGARLLEPGREALNEKAFLQYTRYTRSKLRYSPIPSLCRLWPIPYLPHPYRHLDLLPHIAYDPGMVQYLLR